MTPPAHDVFIAAYRAGRCAVHVERDGAARFVSARLMLPFVLLPVFGASVALALLGHWVGGLAAFLLGLGLRQAVRATAQGFVLTRALHDAAFYHASIEGGLLRVDGVWADPPSEAEIPRDE